MEKKKIEEVKSNDLKEKKSYINNLFLYDNVNINEYH